MRGKGGHFFAIILPRAASIAPRGTPFPRLKWLQPARGRKGNTMIKSASFAVELATQVALAGAIGLIVSLALAGLVLLLAA